MGRFTANKLKEARVWCIATSYSFTDNRSEQNAFLTRLRNGLADEIIEVATCSLIDYHTFMDILHGDWHLADSYNYFKNEVACL